MNQILAQDHRGRIEAKYRYRRKWNYRGTQNQNAHRASGSFGSGRGIKERLDAVPNSILRNRRICERAHIGEQVDVLAQIAMERRIPKKVITVGWSAIKKSFECMDK